MTTSPLDIARALIRCPSVTPAEGGALSCLEKLLGAAGFETFRVTFSDKDTPDVENLFARIAHLAHGSAQAHGVDGQLQQVAFTAFCCRSESIQGLLDARRVAF